MINASPLPKGLVHQGTEILINICRIPPQIGDDAYFVARHIDDWEEGDKQNNVSVVSQKDELCPPKEGEKTESSKRIMVSAYVGADVVGVADGVGGWRQYGVDPGQFRY
jgi:hypothetical protein